MAGSDAYILYNIYDAKRVSFYPFAENDVDVAIVVFVLLLMILLLLLLLLLFFLISPAANRA